MHFSRLWLWAGVGGIVWACGGGGNSGTVVATNPPQPQPARTDLLYGFYGTAPGQIDATHEFTNLVWSGPWKGMAGQIDDLQQAKSRGLPAIVDLSYLLFAERKYVGTDKAKANLREYFAQLAALGLINQIKALYPIDEPDLNADDPGVVVSANRDIRAVVSEFGISPALAVIYGDHGTPGIDSFDWIGRDKYGNGPQQLPLQQGQKLLIISGGADPFRESPEPYLAFAAANPDVVAIIAFVYFDYELGAGIAHNGLLPQYKAAGCRITHRC